MLSMLLALSVASAGNCNVQTLEKALANATPGGVPAAFEALKACDAEAAKAAARDALGRVVGGIPADKLMMSAVGLGAGDAVRAWITSLQSDERSHAIKFLGDVCSTDPAVAPFLVETAASLGDVFWSERWYRATVSCEDPAIKELLRKEVQNPSHDRGRYFGALEIFCRNLGVEAIPYLKAQAIVLKDDQELTLLVNGFADAAGVGRPAGPDPAAAKAAVEGLFEIAEYLPPRGIQAARTTLLTLGAGDREGELAGALYHKLKDADGNLRYGLVAVEKATCKNGKLVVGVHTAEVREPGTMWPQELRPVAEEAARGTWTFDLADKCKGTGEVTFAMTDTPLDAAALPAWTGQQVEAAKKLGAKKVQVTAESPVEM